MEGPGFCYRGDKAPDVQRLSPAHVDFVIATAPNPLMTHLPLMFDRVVEIIQQAAQDDKYSYDSSCFTGIRRRSIPAARIS